MDEAVLAGEWRAAPGDEQLRRDFTDPDFAVDTWEPIAVPSHWRSTPAFATLDGPLLYRTRFSDDELPESRHGDDTRSWLVLDGVFYTSDVWLDGTYVGDTEGYFFPHSFEITDALAGRAEHVLALEVSCAPQTDRTRKRNLTGVFQHGQLLDPDWNPGGVWRPLRVEHSGPVRIRHLRVLCLDAQSDVATVFVRAVVTTRESRTVVLRTTIRDDSGREVVELVSDRRLAAGENRLEWTVTVPNPSLWWPRSLGDRPRYNVGVEVDTEAGPSDARHRTIGLRRVELRNWVFSVNGERLFLKGANHGPLRMALGEADASEFERDVRLATDANLDLLRVHAHVSRPELYEAADVHGLLLWQDLPLQWGYARSVREQARRQAREAVDLLAHHPSVILWCGHNAPFAVDATPTPTSPRPRWRLTARKLVGQMLPTWNKSVLDHSVASVLEKADGSRPVIPHSGVLPHPPQLDGTDTHLYLGWSRGRSGDLARLLRAWPRLGRFVSEFGAQAVPQDAAFLEPERWPAIDWAKAERTRSLQKAHFDEHVPPGPHPTFAGWQRATQEYQARLIRQQVLTLRLLKYRPTGGFAQFCLADAHPSVSSSVVGHDRAPKLGYAALREACAPVVVTVAGLPEELSPGRRIDLVVYAVNDRRIAFDDMVAMLHLDWREADDSAQDRTGGLPPNRSLERVWQGDLRADAVARIGDATVTAAPRSRALGLSVWLRDADGALVAEHHDEVPVRT